MKSIFLLLCALLALATPAKAEETERDTYRHLETFANVLSILQNNYVEPVDSEKVIEGAIKGMLASLDPHSSYMRPEDLKELQVETKGSFTGIGVEITIKDNVITVVSPIEGTPAYAKGIKAGDKILKIGDESTQDMSLTDAVKRLRGEKGSEVTITIMREGRGETEEITLTRDVIPLQSVKALMLDNDYAYARITNFQAKTAGDLAAAIDGLGKSATIKGLILDLRNNPGGLLDQAVRVADLFLEEGIIVSTKGRLEDQTVVYRAHSSGTNYRFPMIALVNEGSASASEIVAGALKDQKRAIILGVQTFGKGSVQTIIPMHNGAGLRLTTALYYTPDGTSIQATGIVPDIEVENQPVVETIASPDDKVLRERDLKRHLENEQETAPQENVEPTEQIPGEEEPGQPVPMPVTAETVAQDQQLYTALLILKGVNVFGTLQEGD
ncbi:MAG: S41 family peptidase [Thermodesulfobacteriota bacterium]